MSAVAWPGVPVDPRPGRRHLRAVPTGPQARGGGRGVGVRVEAVGLRLTARGRRGLAVLALLAVLVGAGAAVRAWASTPAPTVHTVIVHDGETLSGVAHRAYPAMPVSDAVTKVALANDLNSLQVTAGQRLRLPQ